ncbi:MAG: hypothetical protein U0V04_11315 [Spirosomataceae bacterium]
MNFINEIYKRNKLLAHCGTAFLVVSLVLGIYAPFNDVEVLGINSMIKPIKFSLSIWIYAWSFAYILEYFEDKKAVRRFSVLATIVMIFEQAVISIQAFRGKLSHFNQTEIIGGILYALMGIMIVWLTVSTLLITLKFIRQKSFLIGSDKVLSIQLGLIIFIIFSFWGGYMSAVNTHTVGAELGAKGIPFFNWSKVFGDLRIAHFFGVHALQAVPIFGFFISSLKTSESKKRTYVWTFALIYFAFVSFTMIQALMGKSFIS